jgi:hypothetical protein
MAQQRDLSQAALERAGAAMLPVSNSNHDHDKRYEGTCHLLMGGIVFDS